MATDGLSDLGEEWAQKTVWRQDLINSREADFQVLLYDDSTDSLSDSSDIGDVTTEPDSSNSYARQSVSLDASDVTLSVVNGNLEAEFSVTFDASTNSETIDSWAIIADFQSDIVNSEGSKNTHLLATATIGSTNLNNISGDLNIDGQITAD